MEDGDLKGALLACRAIRAVNDLWLGVPRPRLIIRGFSAELPESEFRELEEFKEHVYYRKYSSDPDDVVREIKSASAIIMPSKREGFGLVALEGVAAGIPVLVSDESGMAALLYSADIFGRLGREVIDKCVARVDGKSDEVCREWEGKLHNLLKEQKNSFAIADSIRQKLSAVLTWESVARRLSVEFQKILGR
jgi:glycosyltransferase involved in cell wall biosynthesis